MIRQKNLCKIPTKSDILEYLKEIKPELAKLGIKKIGLFGSYAKGTNSIASDIDIAIESNAKILMSKTGGGIEAIIFLDDLRKSIERKFKVSVDLCDTTSMIYEKKRDILSGVIYV